MERIETDILIAGGGVAGLAALNAFAHAGFRTLCVDPAAQITDGADMRADLRSTAFLQPAIALFDEIGLWSRLVPHATDLVTMRLIDAGGPENEIREIADFKASDIDQPIFGANLPNWLIRREFLAHAEAQHTATLMTGTRVVRVTQRLDKALVQLSNGQQVATKLLIGADGRNSFIRKTSGIDVRRTDFGQKALVFTVSHPLPHDNVSTEVHRTGGPFTLVPLPDQDDAHHSAVVWMEENRIADDLAALDDVAFAQAATARSCAVQGPLTLTSRRALWPIIAQQARDLTAPRTALVAEAAHVMPPIGAQGLNTSLADIIALRDLVRDREDPGATEVLNAYAKARHADIKLRMLGVEALNRAAMSGFQPLRDLRRQGLRLLAGTPPLKSALMHKGLGL